MICDDLMLPRELPASPTADVAPAPAATPPDRADTPGTPEHFNRRLAHLKLRALDYLEHLLDAPEEMLTSKAVAVRRQAASALLRVQPQKIAEPAPAPRVAPAAPQPAAPRPAPVISEPHADATTDATTNATTHATPAEPTAPSRPSRLLAQRPRPSAHAPIDRPEATSTATPRRRRRSPHAPDDLGS